MLFPSRTYILSFHLANVSHIYIYCLCDHADKVAEKCAGDRLFFFGNVTTEMGGPQSLKAGRLPFAHAIRKRTLRICHNIYVYNTYFHIYIDF